MRTEQVVEEFKKLLSQGKVKEAEEMVVREARGREDEVASCLLNTGIEVGTKGDHFVALYCFDAAGKVVKSKGLRIEITQNLAAAHNNYGILLQVLKRYEEAESHYRKALKINPKYAEAHYNYGILLQELRRYEEAESHYRKALKINPKDAEAHNNYGILLQVLKRYEEAESHYRKALKINPKYAEAHNNYGTLLQVLKRYEEAESHYRKALKINPKYAEACGNLGILYSDQKSYLKAIESFERASDIFKEKNMSFDYRKAEALKFSTKARISWREESWGDTRKNLEEAIKNFKACGMEEDATISNNILALVTIDEDFIESLAPRDLLDLRERIQNIYRSIIESERILKESKIHEYKIFAAKFTCIKFLYDALTFQPLNFEDLDNARKTLRDEGFTQAVQSLNVLEIFASDLYQFRSGGLENIPEEEVVTLLEKLTSMRYLDGQITAEIIQDIQKSEPWRKSQTPIQCVSFDISSKNAVKAGIVQFHFNLKNSNNSPEFPPEPEDTDLLQEQFLKYLDEAVKEELDIVCFPELSMTPDILRTIRKRDFGDLIIIGGSYYEERMNVCPIVHKNKLWRVQKIHPSKFEFTPVKEKGMVPGDRLYLFDTHAGKFIVLICEDFRNELYNVLSTVSDLDFLIVISYNPAPGRFHDIANPIPPDYPMYILQSNVAETGDDFGRSCIFGNIDNNYKNDLEKEGLRPRAIFENEVAEIRGEGMLIAEFNTAQKTVPKVTPLDFWTVKNIRVVNP